MISMTVFLFGISDSGQACTCCALCDIAVTLRIDTDFGV
jgi:hypothetical protein